MSLPWNLKPKSFPAIDWWLNSKISKLDSSRANGKVAMSCDTYWHCTPLSRAFSCQLNSNFQFSIVQCQTITRFMSEEMKFYVIFISRRLFDNRVERNETKSKTFTCLGQMRLRNSYNATSDYWLWDNDRGLHKELFLSFVKKLANDRQFFMNRLYHHPNIPTIMQAQSSPISLSWCDGKVLGSLRQKKD